MSAPPRYLIIPGLSVIVAGATGATGREVVAKLVAHPEVGRVVALTRFEISFDKWPLVFPSLKMGDALRHLSVVPINWDQLTKAAAVTSPGTRVRSAISKNRPEPSTPSTPTGTPSTAPTSPSAPVSSSNRSSSAVAGSSSGGVLLTSSSPPTLTTDNQTTSNDKEDQYKGIFSGHDVAICCLGSRSLLNSKELATVDYNYTLAFAKMVAQYGTPPSLQDIEQQRNASVSAHIRRLSLPPALASEILSALSCDSRHLRPSSTPLRKAIFLSTSRASPTSWIPYFRMHGVCDEKLKAIFQCENRTVVVESETTDDTRSRGRVVSACNSPTTSGNGGVDDGSCANGVAAASCPAPACGLSPSSALNSERCNPFPINLQIWRTPLLVRRSESRWIEAALTRVTPSVDSDVLADLIVERALRGFKEEGKLAGRGVGCTVEGGNSKNTCEVLTSTEILESAQVLLRTM